MTHPLFAAVAQHLHAGGFTEEEIAKLMGGVPVSSIAPALKQAEQQRPKLCQGSCCLHRLRRGATPLCPYCEHVDQLQRSALSTVLRPQGRA